MIHVPHSGMLLKPLFTNISSTMNYWLESDERRAMEDPRPSTYVQG